MSLLPYSAAFEKHAVIRFPTHASQREHRHSGVIHDTKVRIQLFHKSSRANYVARFAHPAHRREDA